MHANRFEQINATHGTPAAFVRPINLGALPLRDMNSIVRDATYKDPFPADMTLITISALIKCAAGIMPALVSAMVKGELAAFEESPKRWGSLYGSRIPMKNMVPM